MAGAELELHTLLKQASENEGFAELGWIDLERSREAYLEHYRRYESWLERGYQGAMEYLVRGKERRKDPRLVFPAVESVVVVLQPYRKKPHGQVRSQAGVRYARYIESIDYHDTMKERLDRMMNQVQSRSSLSLEWKSCVDTSAVLERSWAALAGLGWIGKNSLLIHPRLGSYLFIGVVFLNQKSDLRPKEIANYCGNCNRCRTACPTQAFDSNGALDSNRCIAYWTLEKRGALELSEEDQKSMGNWVAGCDLCQEVCPFNLKPVKSSEAETIPENPSDWIELLDESESNYRARIKNSALSRIKPKQFSRNLAIALRSSWFRWSSGERSTFKKEGMVRVEARSHGELDPVALSEWQMTLSVLESSDQ